MRRSKFEKWGRIRQKGLRAWLLRSALSWGLPMYLLMTAVAIAHRPDRWGRIALINLPIWISGGVLWGAVTWALIDRLYRRHMRTHPSE